MSDLRVVGSGWDYFVVIFYFAAIFGFGAIFARFTRSTKDFFFGGQRFSWWLIAFSCIATTVGSYSFVKYSSMGYKYGLSSTMTYLNDWMQIGLLFGWIPIIYFSRVASVPEYFEKRFCVTARTLATISVLIYMIGYIGINLLTMGKVINTVFGVDVFWSAVVVAVICTVYVTAGGQTSVIMTDLAQAVILLAAGFIVFALGLNLLGGWEEFWSGLPVLNKLPFAQFNKPHDFNFIGIFWQDGIANNFTFYFINQGFILRFLSLKSVKEAKKAFLFLPLVLMPLAAFATANAGWIGRSMVEHGILPAGSEADQIFVIVAEKLCGPGMFGFVMAALTAALMSTIDTLINAAATVSVNDVYRPYVKAGASDRHYLFAARIASLACGAVGIALVPLFSSFKSIYEAHAAFIAAVAPPMVVAVILGAFWKRYTPKAAVLTMLFGAAAIGYSIWRPEVIDPFSFGIAPPGRYYYMRALFGLTASAFIAVIATFFTKPKPLGEIEGLVIGTISTAKEKYKGAPVNEAEGKKVTGVLKVRDDIAGVSVNKKMLDQMKANIGDIVYVEDARKWLGGLRSVHSKISDIHADTDDHIYVTPALAAEGELIPGRLHRAELIM